MSKARVQEMANFAYQLVSKVKGQNYKGKYLSYVRKLPSMITYNGLLATVVFAKKKANRDSAEGQAWNCLLEHMKLFLNRFHSYNAQDLVEYLSQQTFQEYRLVTKLLLDFSLWLKNIAEGEIRDESKGD